MAVSALGASAAPTSEPTCTSLVQTFRNELRVSGSLLGVLRSLQGTFRNDSTWFPWSTSTSLGTRYGPESMGYWACRLQLGLEYLRIKSQPSLPIFLTGILI